MIAKCAVTFEFESRPPETWRGSIEGGSAAAIVRRATDAAAKELKPRLWTSMVCCILDRDHSTENEETDVQPADR